MRKLYFYFARKRECGLLPILACNRNCWIKNASHNATRIKISQSTCSYIYSICANKKSIWKKSVRHSFCHTSENTFYSLILNIAVAYLLEVTQVTITNASKYRKKHLTVFDLNRANRKKYWKCESNTFILPHKQEYSLLLYHEYRRNCWKSTNRNDEWVKISQRTSESFLF